MRNFFPYEHIANGSVFFGRDKEVEHVLRHIENSTNLFITSKRRIGKTTLIKNCIEKLDKKEYLAIYIDIFSIIEAEDFARELLVGITKTQKGNIVKTIKKLSSLFKRVAFEPTFDATTGSMGIKPIVSGRSFEEMIEDAFDVLFELSKNKKIVLAIDEFQQIATIRERKIDAILRKYIQEDKNISYIFLGSKRHVLTELFQYKSPLFEMATPMSLDNIAFEHVYKYASKHLKISEDIAKYVYERTDGETKFFQMIFYRAYQETKNKKEVTKELVEKIILDIMIEKTEHYKSVMEPLSTNQKKALKALGIYKKELLSNEVLKEIDISTPSMQSSLKQLFYKEIIDKEDGVWFVPDRMFELWLEFVFDRR